MASGEAIINFCTMEKMFSWTFNDLDKFNNRHLIIKDPVGSYSYSNSFLTTSPIKATDLYGTEYVATCRLQFGSNATVIASKIVVSNTKIDGIIVEISPFPGMIKGWFRKNDGQNHSILPEDNPSSNQFLFRLPNTVSNLNIKKITFYIDVSAYLTKVFKILPFQQPNKLPLCDELKAMWKEDSKNEFIIKCKNEEFKIIKPILASRSAVFKTMFETEMKEKSQIFVEIKEFKPKIVEKMIEFCETDTIADSEGFEDELFKIAHLYQIQQLMYFAVEKMAENIKTENVVAFIQIADLYELNEFKEWCMQFAQRNNIVF